MTVMTDERTPAGRWMVGDPAPLTEPRFGEDYDDSDALCFDVVVINDRVFVCTLDVGHDDQPVAAWGRRVTARPSHGYLRMHRDPAMTFTRMCRDLDNELTRGHHDTPPGEAASAPSPVLDDATGTPGGATTEDDPEGHR